MKYFKIEIQMTHDGQGAETGTILASEGKTKEEAIQDYYTSMGSLVASVEAGTLDSCSCLVLNSNGEIETPYSGHYPIPER